MSKIEKLVTDLSGLTVLEAAELSKLLEDKWGVSAAPVAMATPTSSTGGASVEAEKTEFDVKLASFGEKKVEVIKVVREATSLGLKEAKDLVEANGVVKKGLNKADAEKLKSQLEAAGAKVEVN